MNVNKLYATKELLQFCSRFFFRGHHFLSTRNIVGVVIIIRWRIWGVDLMRGGKIWNNYFKGNQIAKMVPPNVKLPGTLGGSIA